MADLNALVEPPSNVVVANPSEINDRGEITAEAVLPDGTFHSVVLIPAGDCDRNCEQRMADYQNQPRVLRPAATGIGVPHVSRLLRNPSRQRLGVPNPSALLPH